MYVCGNNPELRFACSGLSIFKSFGLAGFRKIIVIFSLSKLFIVALKDETQN
jgi:hypothetical protein